MKFTKYLGGTPVKPKPLHLIRHNNHPGAGVGGGAFAQHRPDVLAAIGVEQRVCGDAGLMAPGQEACGTAAHFGFFCEFGSQIRWAIAVRPKPLQPVA